MGRAEEKYEYLSKREKYDPDVRKAVGSKSLSEKDANKINKIQDMMQKEREKKGSRTVVTSENREQFMKKKLGLTNKEKEIRADSEKKPSGEGGKTEKPHGIYHSGTDELHSHYPTHDEAYKVYSGLRRNYDYAIGELSEKERKLHKYE